MELYGNEYQNAAPSIVMIIFQQKTLLNVPCDSPCKSCLYKMLQIEI